ncbi:MAG: hypothetical protein JXA11_06615 [Phycisphaerae bacterium]|nr:hypothetical protein [Phycisphaerae bacterium]
MARIIVNVINFFMIHSFHFRQPTQAVLVHNISRKQTLLRGYTALIDLIPIKQLPLHAPFRPDSASDTRREHGSGSKPCFADKPAPEVCVEAPREIETAVIGFPQFACGAKNTPEPRGVEAPG